MPSLVWYGPGTSLDIHGFTLTEPMVYVKTRQNSVEPSALNPKSEVVMPEGFREDAPFRPAGFHPNYYPHWENMRPQGRWSYLWWLANNRQPFPTAISYAFLYLYGLERRVVEEKQDFAAVWHTTSDLYLQSDNISSSFRHYSEQLLWHIVAKHPDQPTELEIRSMLGQMGIHRGYMPLELAVALWWFGSREIPVPPEAAYHLALSFHTGSGVVLDRAEPELRRLFMQRFEERYGGGMMVEFMPKRHRTFLYHCSNAYLPSRGSAINFPDPFGKPKRFEKLAWLFDTCVNDLRKFAIALGKFEEDRLAPAVWEALPLELRTTGHPATKILEELGGEELEQTGYFAAVISELAPLLGITMRETLPLDGASRLAVSIEECGLSVEPDPRLSGRGYNREETVVLFRPEAPTPALPTEEQRTRYQTSSFLLKSAYHIASAGGPVNKDSLSLIAQNLLTTYAWNEDEARRFKALAGLLLLKGVDATTIRIPAGWTGELREGSGQMLLQLVEQDGQVNSEEEKALRAMWKKLGLTPGSLNKELDAMSSRGVVFVGNAVVGAAGERLPAPPSGWNGTDTPVEIVLDKSAIAILLQETHHVQRALADAMAIEEVHEPEPAPAPTPEPVEQSPEEDTTAAGLSLAQLSERFRPFLIALLERDEWPEPEARALAKDHNLMLAGAVEAINDWSVEEFGEAIIWDEGDRLVIERAVFPA